MGGQMFACSIISIGWKVFVGDPEGAENDFDDGDWKTVTLPYAWNEKEAFRKDIRSLSTGIAWYRKHFSVPAEHAGCKIFLEFEGIRQGVSFISTASLSAGMKMV